MELKTLIVVDDDELLLRALQRSLRGEYSVLVAADALQALGLLDKRNDVAAVVTDMEMGGVNGLELLGQIRQRWPRVRRILMTGSPSVDRVGIGPELPAQATLMKPFDARQLRQALGLG